MDIRGAIQYVQHLDGARHRKNLQAKLAQAKEEAGDDAESEASGSGPAAQPLAEPIPKDSILRCQHCGIARFTSYKSKLEHWKTPEHQENFDNGHGTPKKKMKHSK